jgi:serpin B
MLPRKHLLASRGGCLIASLFCFVAGHSHAATAKDLQQLSAANTRFAFNLLKQVVAGQPETNVFISPYSVSTVLQMVATGATGSTLKEMDQALSVSGLPASVVNEGNRELGGILNNRNTNFILTAANAVWYRSTLPVYASFLNGDARYYGATAQGLDFSDPSASATINAWAAQETRGLITQIVPAVIPADTEMYLANAVYFLGNWASPFNTNSTTDQGFQLDGGGTTTVPMMRQMGTFAYGVGDHFQILQLPYQGGDLSMYVFLPDPGVSLTKLMGQMTGAWWRQAIPMGLTPQWGLVELPRFNLECPTDLKPPLQALGMKTAFTLHANFAKISPVPLRISSVTQKAVVQVNEVGTVAAAVTTIGVIATAILSPTYEFIADHPFLFVIQDQQAGTALFMGAVFNP